MGSDHGDWMGNAHRAGSAAGDGAGDLRADRAGVRGRSTLTRQWRRRLVLLPVAALVGIFGCATILQSDEQRVVLSTDPAGAMAAVNGTPMGTTPVEVVLKPTGQYVVSFEKAGCQAFSQTLAHEAAWGTFGTVQYPITQLKPAHVRLACGQSS